MIRTFSFSVILRKAFNFVEWTILFTTLEFWRKILKWIKYFYAYIELKRIINGPQTLLRWQEVFVDKDVLYQSSSLYLLQKFFLKTQYETKILLVLDLHVQQIKLAKNADNYTLRLKNKESLKNNCQLLMTLKISADTLA